MITKTGFAVIVLLIVFLFGSCNDQDVFSILKGPYLGQTPPGKEPEIFAPGLITTHYSQSYIAFLNEARVCVYSTTTEKGHETFYTYEKNGCWTRPQKAPFEELQGHPNYTTGPFGRKVYFHSGNPTHPDDTRYDDNIWTIEWTGSGWAEPQVLPKPANSEYGEAYPSAAADGTVYFFTWKREGTRGDDIWFSRCIDGKYQEAERLPWPINTDFIEYDPYVSPDESFLIFGSTRPGGYGNSDNYVSFRKEDGNWTHPINLGRPLNSTSWDLCANGTPDGKYFFFISGRKTDIDKGEIGKKSGEEPQEDSDLYWVDFSFIKDLENTVLSKQDAAEIIKQDYGENGIRSAVDKLNKLYSNQKNGTYFSPFELLSLCKNMIAEDKFGDADIFFAALDDVLPKDFSIKEGYARICAMNGRVSKGLKILEGLESKDPNFNLSDSLSRLGYLFTLYPDKTEDALSVLQFTVEKFPEDPWAYYSLARVHRQIGNLDKAIANCRKALEIKPSVGDISQLLERLLQEKKESIPVLKGPYLGQKPPGMTPKIFVPGIVSTDVNEVMYGFYNDGSLFFFERSAPNFEKDWIYIPVYRTEIKNGVWTEPQKSAITGRPWFYEYSEASEGTKIFFAWRKNLDGSGPQSDIDLWRTVKVSKGWAPPERLGPPVNTNRFDSWPSLSQSETLYFFSSREGGFGKTDLYRSILHKGEYTEIENLGNTINSKFNDHDPYIAPDENFLLWCSDRPGGFGKNDLYISYCKQDGTWSLPKNMGDKINSAANDTRPYVTPDGKYLFFNSNKSGNRDIYWVDAKIIQDFKPKELK